MVNIDPDKFRPLGRRVLVRRYSLPEQSAGGIYVLGRDYPTMGIVAATRDHFWTDTEIQWEIKADFDSRLVGDNLLLLDEDDINVRFISGQARAVNDRLLLRKIAPLNRYQGWLARAHEIMDQYSVGSIASCGWQIPIDEIHLRDRVIFDRSFASEIYLNNERHLIVRYEHCLAVVEQE